MFAPIIREVILSITFINYWRIKDRLKDRNSSKLKTYVDILALIDKLV